MGPWTGPLRSPSSLVKCWHGQKHDFASLTCLALIMCTIRKAVEVLRERLTLNPLSFISDKILPQDYFTVM